MRVLSAVAFIACTAAPLLVSGCGAFRPTVRGSGVVATESRDVAGFTSIDLSGFGTVHVEQTGAESLTVEAEDNLLPLLETRVENGRLKLTTKPDVNIHATRPVVYRITVDKLQAVTVSGSGKIHAPRLQTPRLAARVSGSGGVRVDDLDAEQIDGRISGSGGLRIDRLDARRLTGDISGSGDVRLAGRADDVDLEISGSGSYNAADLECRQASVSIAGSGGATINAVERLDAAVTGSGSVRYLGKPEVNTHITGSGSVRRANGG